MKKYFDRNVEIIKGMLVLKGDFKLFTIGPLEMEEEILRMGSEKLPYFRTEEFSKINLNITKMLKQCCYTREDSEVVLLTASGSAAMEAAVINAFCEKDNLLVIEGGSFGKRFTQICEVHNIPHTVLKLNHGQVLTKEKLYCYKEKEFTGLLINANETTTGVYHDIQMVGEFCKVENITFVVDAISSFLADRYYMDEWNIDITILSSQKALALPPGMSFLIINKKTANKIMGNTVKSLYFDLKEYFINMERGQTPFSPAVGILLQLEKKLKMIQDIGVDNIVKNTENLALDFRKKIKELPFLIPCERLSNAVTSLQPRVGVSAFDIFTHLKNKYNIFVCPNGGELTNTLFRVGHIGNLTYKDNKIIIDALHQMNEEGLL